MHHPLQGDQVKKGQVLAYVEQLGTFVAVEVGPRMQSASVICCLGGHGGNMLGSDLSPAL
jgi:hypothetical protein